MRLAALVVVSLAWAWAIITLGVFMASMLAAQQSGVKAPSSSTVSRKSRNGGLEL